MPRIIIDRDTRISGSSSSSSLSKEDKGILPNSDYVKITSNTTGGIVVDVPEGTQFKVTVLKD